MRIVLILLLFAWAVPADERTLTVSGDAEIQVVPNQATLFLGVEARNRDLALARKTNDELVKTVLASARKSGVAPADVQTDFIQVDVGYEDRRPWVVEYYIVRKSVVLVLRDISRFEETLAAALEAGATHVHGVEFRTTQLRKHRDEARARAIKAAIEKANDLAAAAGLKVAPKPLGISSYNYGGMSWYGSGWHGYGRRQMAQNVVLQAGDSGGPEGTIALGRISVTASVSMQFRLE